MAIQKLVANGYLFSGGAALSSVPGNSRQTSLTRASYTWPWQPIMKLFKNIRIGSLNVGTMRGRSGEIVETVSRRRISVCAIQESRWKGQSARILSGKNSKYKFYWSGDGELRRRLLKTLSLSYV